MWLTIIKSFFKNLAEKGKAIESIIKTMREYPFKKSKEAKPSYPMILGGFLISISSLILLFLTFYEKYK